MSGWWERDEPNGSKAVSLLLRLSALILALASAVMMATADNCTVAGATPTAVNYRDYGAFVYLVWANVAAAVLEAAAVYLQLSGAGDDDGDDRGSQVPGVVLVVVDVLAQALLYSSTGAAYGCGKVGVDVCVAFGQQVGRSKLLSFGASISLGLAAVVKDVSLPFNVWPG
ncbi:CASP-like protein 1U2 [Triticum urartu]|uniref:CASP-like protein 1U2 n=1 Tax=Triticum urartu TaxID=4572 RepID=UPI00204446C1|nr:CASP-like protein 1U2 [Triticum urartu]XP_048574736.1 CASP-like protein 1U2 [Triticum urartu]